MRFIPASWSRAAVFVLMAWTPLQAGAQVSVAGNSGVATMAYPFRLPAARGRYQPTLALRYNSADSEMAFGVGWSMPPSHIALPQRQSQTPDGSVAPDQFILVLNGQHK